MKKFESYTTISNGKFNPSCTREILQFVKENEGKRARVIIEVGSKRSNPQNSYYWGAVLPIVQQGFKDMGHEVSKEQVHDFLKARFNYKEIINQSTGEILKMPSTTTSLNKSEFGDYLDSIIRFASEYLGVLIPEAGHQTELIKQYFLNN